MNGSELQNATDDFDAVVKAIRQDHVSRYRDGKPPTLSDLTALRDVREEYRSGLFGRRAETCRGVRLVWTECNFGGVRPWFLCPGCGHRVVLLFNGGCRRCKGIRYESQYAPPLHGYRVKSARIRKRLGEDWGSLFDFVPRRPKRMRSVTYSKLLDELQAVELAAIKLLAPDVPGMHRQVHERFVNARRYEAMLKKYGW